MLLPPSLPPPKKKTNPHKKEKSHSFDSFSHNPFWQYRKYKQCWDLPACPELSVSFKGTTKKEWVKWLLPYPHSSSWCPFKFKGRSKSWCWFFFRYRQQWFAFLPIHLSPSSCSCFTFKEVRKMDQCGSTHSRLKGGWGRLGVQGTPTLLLPYCWTQATSFISGSWFQDAGVHPWFWVKRQQQSYSFRLAPTHTGPEKKIFKDHFVLAKQRDFLISCHGIQEHTCRKLSKPFLKLFWFSVSNEW